MFWYVLEFAKYRQFYNNRNKLKIYYKSNATEWHIKRIIILSFEY